MIRTNKSLLIADLNNRKMYQRAHYKLNESLRKIANIVNLSQSFTLYHFYLFIHWSIVDLLFFLHGTYSSCKRANWKYQQLQQRIWWPAYTHRIVNRVNCVHIQRRRRRRKKQLKTIKSNVVYIGVYSIIYIYIVEPV